MFFGDFRAASVVALLVWIGFAVPSVAAAEVFFAGPSDDVEAQINALQPGDELVLSGGMYTLSERFSFAIVGTETAPITIRAADGEVPRFDRPNANENIIDIDQAEHVTIRGIEFSGGSAGIRISGARFLTIEGCEVHDTGDVAIRANDSGVTYESLRILGNHIHHTNQPSVSQGDGIELKEGSPGNVIRDNVIHDTNYPCILTYASNGAANIIERNVMWNCGDHGIQSAADAVIRNNIILGANADGIAMQPHQSGSPSELVVVHNTVLNAGGDAISLRGISGSVVVANNALYAQDGSAFFVNGGTSGLVFAGNAGMGGVSDGALALLPGDIDIDFVGASFSGAPPMSVFPTPGSALAAAASPVHVVADDFNGTPRAGSADIGAYRFSADGNPGWELAETPKTSTPTNNPGTGGTGGSIGGSGGSGGDPRSGPPASGGSSGCRVGSTSDSTAQLMTWLIGSLLWLRRTRRPLELGPS